MRPFAAKVQILCLGLFTLTLAAAADAPGKNQLPSGQGISWKAYTDGYSSLTLHPDSAGDRNPDLRLQWTLKPGAAHPYAGAQGLLQPDGKGVDLSRYAGVRFFARGRGSCHIALPTDATRQEYNHYQTAVVLYDEGRFYELPFSIFSQSWGNPQAWDPTSVYALQIDGGTKTGSLEIRQIGFFSSSQRRLDSRTGMIYKRPKTNQLGYLPNAEKTFSVVASAVHAGETFAIVDAAGNTAYSGQIPEAPLNNFPETGESIFRGDFSALQTPGTYAVFLKGKPSHVFSIRENCYLPLFQDALRAFSLIRCGTAVSDIAAGWQHAACHLQDAPLRTRSEQKQDFTGGWHNACDYGKWCHMHAITLAYFLWLYELTPAAEPRGQNMLLAEAVWGLRFLLKMQYPDGSVYHKVDSEPAFCFGTPPDQDKLLRQAGFQGAAQPQNPSAIDAGTFTAVMAQASRVFADYDPALARECRRAAFKTWAWMQHHPPTGQNDPYYTDTDYWQEIFWAQAEMFRLTGDAKLETMLEKTVEENPLQNLSWQTPQAFGYLSLWQYQNTDGALKAKIKAAVQTDCDALLKTAHQSGYGVALRPDQYYWESNETVLHQANILLFGYLMTGTPDYRTTALQQLDYLLGLNALDQSFITGHGSRQVRQPYHWTYAAYGEILPGWVSGGPNSNTVGADAALRTLIGLGTPPAKCYLDMCEDAGSYASNEGEITANAALVFLTGFISFFELP
ncbi:MAG: hypothetical protein HGA76_03495 [Candidatus Firestonebacteria bacterium]|nr:hypothetical protein [Candidatus Firestonebacteria bacterium]